jgi:hypothetical protein
LAAENSGGSGVKSTSYSIDLGVAQAYEGRVTVSKEGTTTVGYFSTDNADNVETSKTATIRIDKTLPSVSLDAGGSYTGAATIHASASDALSGLGHVDMKLDSGSWSTETVLSTTAIGSHVIYARAFDLAGNERDVSASFVVMQPPIGTTTRLAGPSSVKVNKALKLIGTISPAGAPGRVVIAIARLVRGNWRNYATVRVIIVRGAFSYSFRPKYRGSWRFVASYSGGVSGYLIYRASKSGIKGVKVK